MSEATLAIRPEETVYLWEKPFEVVLIGEYQYQVALVETPPLPEPSHWPLKQPRAVVAIQKYTVRGETKWGWVHLPPETKNEIGTLLEHANAETGRWYWLLVSPLSERPTPEVTV